MPVVAPGFLRFPVSRAITPERMRDYVQCVIRDTARHTPPRDYFVIEGAHSWTVSDQLMKRELILQGMGWGHMPRFLIEPDLRETTSVFDGAGNVAHTIDEDGKETDFAYDLENRRIGESDPDHDATTTLFDGAGNVAARIDARGKRPTMSMMATTG